MTEKTIYALGFFDGVHLGHQALLSACLTLAKQNNCRTGVVTFGSHPDGLVSGNQPGLINTIGDREALLRTFGMETVLTLPFDRQLMTTPWDDFLRALEAQGAVGFVCGSDFRFGAGGQGTAEKLSDYCRERGLHCAVVPQQRLEGVRISSTHIRKLLAGGELEAANQFLGHPHRLTGQVIHGRGLGHTIGIPTANLALPPELVQPKFGVYACTTVIGGKTYAAVTNIGTRPTVEGHRITVEPWILDFSGDLYGKTITLSFHAFLRPEQKFPSLEALQAQIRKDGEKTANILETF